MQIVDEQYRIPDTAQVDMLRKLALYWDGQWFLRTVEEFGLDAGIRANAQVRASFGRIEMRTILKTLKKKKANDLADAMQLLKTYLGVFMGKRLRTKFSLLSDTEAAIVVTHCPAFEGSKHARLERSDQACVACEGLWPSWLNVLLPDDTIDIQIPMQQGKGDPSCHFIVRIVR